MIEDDYLLRQIRAFVQAVMRAKEDDDEHSLHEAISSGLRNLCGLSAEALSRLSPEAIAPLLTLDGRLERDKARAVAALLLEDAALQRDPGAAHARRVAGVGILALCGVGGVDELEHLDGVARTVHLASLHGSTLSRLAAAYEAAGRYDRAEDVIFAWLDVDLDAAFAGGMALYERLWALPDARLRAGGLSADEVLESMADLQARAGRS